MSPYFAMSTGRERICEDMSATSGTPPVSGVQKNSTPPIVSFVQMWT